MTESQLSLFFTVSSFLSGLAYAAALCVFVLCVSKLFIHTGSARLNKSSDVACFVLATIVALSVLISAAEVVPVFFGPYQRFALKNRLLGHNAWAFWLITIPACVAPQLLWWKRFRTPIPACIIACIAANPLVFDLFVGLVVFLHRVA